MNQNESDTNPVASALTEQAKEARRAYQKKWRAANRDKVKATQQRHWEKKAAEMMAAAEGKEETT